MKTAAQRWAARQSRLEYLALRILDAKAMIDPDSPGGRLRRGVLRRRFSRVLDAAIVAETKATAAKKRENRRQC